MRDQAGGVLGRLLLETWAAGVLAALVAIVLGFTAWTAVAVYTVRTAHGRARRQTAGWGELRGAFPESTLVTLDEALDRAFLEAGQGIPHRG
jgi:hypothetical protein